MMRVVTAVLAVMAVMALGGAGPALAQTASGPQSLDAAGMKAMCDRQDALCVAFGAGTRTGHLMGAVVVARSLAPQGTEFDPAANQPVIDRALGYCAPGVAGFGLLGGTIKQWLSDHPDRAAMPAPNAAYLAFAERFPCGRAHPTPTRVTVPKGVNAAMVATCLRDAKVCVLFAEIVGSARRMAVALSLANLRGGSRSEIFDLAERFENVCIPQGTGSDQIGQTIQRYIANHPERRDDLVFRQARAALEVTWPCTRTAPVAPAQPQPETVEQQQEPEPGDKKGGGWFSGVGRWFRDIVVDTPDGPEGPEQQAAPQAAPQPQAQPEPEPEPEDETVEAQDEDSEGWFRVERPTLPNQKR